MHDERAWEHAAGLVLTVCTWLWGDKYGPKDVAKLASGVQRHLKQDYRFVVLTEEDRSLDEFERFPALPEQLQFWSIFEEDRHLLKIKGCFVRLRMFDPGWQERRKIKAGDRIVCMDLDVVITGPLDPLFNRPENFVILHGANQVNPCKFNGSLFMLRAGEHPEVWRDFSLEEANKIKFFSFPDDQSWFEHKLPKAAGWECGERSGVWSFAKRGWPKDNKLPAGARLVVFPGSRDPSQFTHLSWVREHWRVQ